MILLLRRTQKLYVRRSFTRFKLCKAKHRTIGWVSKQNTNNASKNVWALPTFSVILHFYVNHLPLFLILKSKMSSVWYKKLLFYTAGQFTIIDVKSHVRTIHENGIPYTVTTHRAGLVPKREFLTKNIKRQIGSTSQATLPSRVLTNGMKYLEYVSQKVVAYHDSLRDILYKIHWYGYIPEECTWKPLNHIPNHFIDRYW